MELNSVINGDAIEEMKKMPDDSIDLIFADPPYWMRTKNSPLKRVEGTIFDGVYENWDVFSTLDDYNRFTEKWLFEARRILKKNGSIWVICGMQCIHSIGFLMQKLGFWIINEVIWQKSNPTPNFMGTRLNNSHETLIWATKSKNSKYTFNYKTAKELNVFSVESAKFKSGVRRQLGSIWKLPVSSGLERLKDDFGQKLHSTQKPFKLLYLVLAISSKVDQIILDPFAGTMTTAAAAKSMGRKFIMIERETKYCKYGKSRIDNIDENIGLIEKAVYDIKPPKVTLEEMINSEFLRSGEILYFKKSEKSAKLAPNGRAIYNNEMYSIHELAAIFSSRNAKRLNGFDYFMVKREVGLRSLKEIRSEYRREVHGWGDEQ